MGRLAHNFTKIEGGTRLPPTIHPYAKALSWCRDAKGKSFVLLGNGFSMAYDRHLFGYAALADHAADRDHLSAEARSLMEALGTKDFEAAMRALRSTMATLRALDPKANKATIRQLGRIVVEIREALVRSVAGLHPERPQDIDDRCYLSVRRFLEGFNAIYSANYDLLLYWALMQDLKDGAKRFPSRAHDDGFRDSGVDGDETVLWNIYNPYGQSVHYLHGALHLYLGIDGLRKLTWNRTGIALIDQVREQLDIDRYPLYVAEADSQTKLDRINRSAYLSKALRSLSSVGGSLVVYGHSLDSNDNHILEAIVRSNIRRAAFSIYGDPTSKDNRRIITAAKDLQAERNRYKSNTPLEVRFYQAESVELWEPV